VFIRIKTKETQAESNQRIDNALEELENGIIIIASVKGHYDNK
jgi:hypothetical protein